MVSISISSTKIPSPEFQSSFFHSCPTRCKCSRIVMTMDSDSSLPMKNWKKIEASLQLSSSAPLVHRVETSRFCDLRFDRLQPPDHELDIQKIFEFDQFVAREALFDEEYWTFITTKRNLWIRSLMQ